MNYIQWQIGKGATVGLANVMALMVLGLLIILFSPIVITYLIVKKVRDGKVQARRERESDGLTYR